MSDNQKINIEEKVMSQIRKGQAKMKPKWFFLLGSVAMISGLTGLTIISIFLVSLITFSLRARGPMGALRLEQLLSSFPWEAVIVAVIGLGLAVFMLRKYDFSYKKNFLLIIISFVLSILLAGLLINYSGLDTLWMKKWPMKGLYQRYDRGSMIRKSDWRIMQNTNPDFKTLN
ncbi:MAG: hypothetical protein KAR00_03455 [Candidatus Pacebacteria bacterium]|nr:hypothetical protein [Candidatus Paceibacterota bacterium]